MFSLRAVLSTHHREALKVWDKGAPKADTVEQARQEWAPYLATWAKCIEGDYRAMVSSRWGRERIGWIDDANFWAAFWKASDSNLSKTTQSYIEATSHLDRYMESAAAVGSMSFFQTMPHRWVDVFERELRSGEVLVAPEVLDWFEQKRPASQALAEGQFRALRASSWKKLASYAHVYKCRGTIPKEAALERVCALAARIKYNGAGDLLDLMGHVLVNFVDAGQADAAIVRIEKDMGDALPNALNLRLVAMCSGHALDNAPNATAIAHLGRLLLLDRPLTCEGLWGPAAAIAAVVTSLENIGSLPELYYKAMQLGLHRKQPETAFEVDGQLFASPLV